MATEVRPFEKLPPTAKQIAAAKADADRYTSGSIITGKLDDGWKVRVDGWDVTLSFKQSNDATQATVDLLNKTTQFTDWCKNLERGMHEVTGIKILDIYKFGPKIGFVTIEANIISPHTKQPIPVVFIRGHSVGMLMVLLEQMNY